MSTDQQQYLWDTEHIAFCVETKVFPKWRAALRANDAAAIGQFLADRFEGAAPNGDRLDAPWSDDVVLVRRQNLDEADSVALDRDAFVGRLLSLTSHFEKGQGGGRDCKVEMGLVRLSPLERRNLAGLWKGVWSLRLFGRRDRTMVEVSARMALDLAPLDERVLAAGGWIRAARLESVQVVEGRAPLMADVTAESGIDARKLHDNWQTTETIIMPGGVYAADYDGDGNLDLLIDDVAGGLALCRGLGDGRFRDVTDDAGLPRHPGRPELLGSPPCWADLDRDGDEDLVVYGSAFENLGDGRFRDVTDRCNLNVRNSSGIAAADFDGDGKIDLFESHANAPCYKSPVHRSRSYAWVDGKPGFHNVLWRNLGDWRFEDVSDKSGAGGNGGATMASAWFDANADGAPDLLSVNEFGCNAMMLNRRDGTFKTIEDIDPVFGGFSMGVAVGDYDNDGCMDVYVTNMYSKAGSRVLANVDPACYAKELYAKLVEGTAGNKLYRGLGDGRFEVVPTQAAPREIGWSYGAALCDLNGDGSLDVYSTAGYISRERGKPDG